jgi:hypothetical protein
MLVVIGTDCKGSCKSNYHAIMATTDPNLFDINECVKQIDVSSINKTDCHDITEILLKVSKLSVGISR